MKGLRTRPHRNQHRTTTTPESISASASATGSVNTSFPTRTAIRTTSSPTGTTGSIDTTSKTRTNSTKNSTGTCTMTSHEEQDGNVEDKLHPKAKFTVSLFPGGGGGGSGSGAGASGSCATEVQQQSNNSYKKTAKLEYQRTLSAIDDSDDDDRSDIADSDADQAAAVASTTTRTTSVGQDIVQDPPFPEEEEVVLDALKVAAAATVGVATSTSSSSNIIINNKKKNKNKKSMVATASANSPPHSLPTSPTAGVSTATVTRAVVSPSPQSSSSKGAKIKGDRSLSLKDEAGEDSPSSSSSSLSSSSSQSSAQRQHHQQDTDYVQNLSHKLDLVDHSTQTMWGMTKFGSTTSATKTTRRFVRWSLIIAGIVLVSLTARRVIQDPTLPHRTVDFVLHDMPRATVYKTQLKSTQQELWNVLIQSEQLRSELDVLTEAHRDHVRQSQVTEAKYKTLTQKYDTLLEEHEEQRNQFAVLRRDYELHLEWTTMNNETHTASGVDAEDDGSVTAAAAAAVIDQEREQEQLRHERFMKELEQSRREQEEELARYIHQKSFEMQRRLLDDFERVRVQRLAELDEELQKLKDSTTHCERSMYNTTAATTTTVHSNISTAVATEMTIGQQVDIAARLLTTKTKKVRERVLVASSTMVDLPVHSTESVFLKGGVFTPGEPILPRNIGQKLKTATVRLAEESKNAGAKFGTLSMKAAKKTVRTLESSSRTLLQGAHQVLVKAEEKLAMNEVLVQANHAIKAVEIRSEQSFLLKGAWNNGDPLVPKVVDRMFKSVQVKTKVGIDLLQKGIRSVQFPPLQKTKEIMKIGLNHVSRAASPASALLKSGMRKTTATRGIAHLSRTANSTSTIVKGGLQRSKKRLATATNTSFRLLRKISHDVGTKVSRTSHDMRVQSIKYLHTAKSTSERLMKQGIHHSFLVSMKAGEQTKQVTVLSVEKLSSTRVHTRAVLTKAADRSLRIVKGVGTIVRTGLEVGKKKMVQVVGATNELWRDVKIKSAVGGNRIGSGVNNFKGRGNRVWDEAKESVMTTFALAFPHSVGRPVGEATVQLTFTIYNWSHDGFLPHIQQEEESAK